ncbi:cardiolipin synthase [Acholeplasma granularum]|uniref:cardiolipin synthase n=1 Tax=Acholeplasma granularum TaxID=264635 RepID=UPI00047063BB|nr:cardiolipin synthase [Acholeplasma granularum]
MRKFINLVTNRLTIIGLILLLQIILLWLFVYKFAASWYYMHLTSIILGIIISLYMITTDENPMFKLIWIVFLLTIPVFGVLFYFYSRTERISYASSNAMIRSQKNREQETAKLSFQYSQEYKKHQIYLTSLNFPSFKNTKSLFLGSGEEKQSEMLRHLKQAKHFIFMEYFIITISKMWDEILEVLIQKQKEGVEIKIIYDDFGSATKLPFNYHKKLQKLGFEVIRFNPLKLHLNYGMNFRDHRKIVVIDNKVAFTGGVNIGDEYTNKKHMFGHWNDAAIMIEGNAVWGMTLIFLENWTYSTKQINLDFSKYNLKHEPVYNENIYIPFSDIPADKNLTAKNIYLHLINDAKKSVYITAPYLILDNEIATALKLASQSGVSVNIIMPSIPDKKLVYMVSKSYAEELVRSGVKVYKYIPGFIHSKMIITDKKVAMIGSSNLDFRSLYMHLENNIWLNDEDTIKQMTNYFEYTIKESELISLENIKRRSIFYKVFQAILKGFSPLL